MARPAGKVGLTVQVVTVPTVVGVWVAMTELMIHEYGLPEYDKADGAETVPVPVPVPVGDAAASKSTASVLSSLPLLSLVRPS